MCRAATNTTMTAWCPTPSPVCCRHVRRSRSWKRRCVRCPPGDRHPGPAHRAGSRRPRIICSQEPETPCQLAPRRAKDRSEGAVALVHLGKVGTLLIKDPEPGHLCANATGIAFVGLTFLDACHEAGV